MEYLVWTWRRTCRPQIYALKGGGLVSVAIGSWKLTWWTGNRAATYAWVWDMTSSLAHSWEGTLEPGPYSTGRRCSARSPSPDPVVIIQGKNLRAGPHQLLPTALAAAPILPSRSVQLRPPPPKPCPNSPPWCCRTSRLARSDFKMLPRTRRSGYILGGWRRQFRYVWGTLSPWVIPQSCCHCKIWISILLSR
jgi:hypothetical protein